MDLHFCSMMLESTRGQKFCEKKTIQTLGTLFDGWPGIDNNISSCNMGCVWLFFFHFMLWWNGKEVIKPVCADGYELRNHFLLYLLKHRGNEAKDNLPDIVREFIKRIQ